MPPIPSTASVRFLTVDECSTLARAPRKSVEHWIYSGQLPATVRGKRRLVREDVLIRWLEGEDVRVAKAG